jgi:hypothetical protein
MEGKGLTCGNSDRFPSAAAAQSATKRRTRAIASSVALLTALPTAPQIALPLALAKQHVSSK